MSVPFSPLSQEVGDGGTLRSSTTTLWLHVRFSFTSIHPKVVLIFDNTKFPVVFLFHFSVGYRTLCNERLGHRLFSECRSYILLENVDDLIFAKYRDRTSSPL